MSEEIRKEIRHPNGTVTVIILKTETPNPTEPKKDEPKEIKK